jgi:hypothetical protein
MPLLRATLATDRLAELGFLGGTVYTRTQMPLRCGLPLSAAVGLRRAGLGCRPRRSSWFLVRVATWISQGLLWLLLLVRGPCEG